MPLGRDSIKRVKNNGYSRVTTTAPDMENSSIVESIELPVVVVEVPLAEPVKEPKRVTKKKAEPKQAEKKEPARKKPAGEKKSEAKPKAKRTVKKSTPVSNNDIPTPAEVVAALGGKEPEGYITLGGGELPVYLL